VWSASPVDTGHASITSARPTHAEIGIPEARPFATHKRSGTTPSWSHADLVGDQQPAALVAQRPQCTQESVGRNALATAGLDRFDEDSADGRCAGLGSAHHVFGIAEAGERSGAGETRCEGFAESRAVGGVERTDREAVIGALEGDDAGASSREGGGLQGQLHGVAARRSEHRARRPAARKAPRQRLEQLHLHGRGMHIAHSMEQCRRLLRHGRHHARVRVPRVRHAEGAREIHVAIAVDVPDVRALRALPEDRRLGREAGDVPRFDRPETFGERPRARARHVRHERGELVGRGRHDASV
jgi:hypothetical protein